ncbi:MAG: acyl-CoA reductase [Oscillospiraceae bacterium]|nr:acyl-CoA reductase [Oscillospiraceae bacterium]
MILANGKIYESSEQNAVLDRLEAEINYTRASHILDTEMVISAADTLGKKIADGEFNDIISEFLGDTPDEYLKLAADFMNADNLSFRIHQELGKDFSTEHKITPPYGLKQATVKLMPLGTLFHIAAGNMDGLPAFSVLEGLLTGNVNILKLPQADNGLTLKIFRKLIEIEPRLAPFIYVFDTPSSDVAAMKKMAEISDGIIVWGGDAAVSAVRALAPTGAKLIEWGHKLGFAYISGFENKDAELSALAKHIIDTRQLLCSSCQTIFIDTEDMTAVTDFCREFLPYLEAAERENPITETGAVAEMTLRRYTEQLEGYIDKKNNDKQVFQGNRCSLTACEDSVLELSYMYGNCLVKRLPRSEIMATLRKSKGYLQTAGLICTADKREELTDILERAGVNRIMRAGNMSITFCGETHDGEYPLRRYMRVVNIE